jgi:glycosyltransferase involved in cell wall biosynthesis
MRKLRVLFTIPTPMLKGGMESVMMNFIRHFDHEKVQVDVLQCRVKGYGDGVYDSEIRSYGGAVYYVPSERFLFRYIKGIKRLLKANAYDVVHCHFLDDRSYIPLKLAKQAGVPLRIAHVHNTRHVPGRNLLNRVLASLSNGYFERHLAQVATDFFACSSLAAKDFFAAKNIPQSKVAIIPNAVDVSSYRYSVSERSRIRKELGIPEDALVMGLIARLRLEQKNQLFLLPLLSTVQKSKPNAYLLLLGKGPDEAKIKEEIAHQGLKNVVLVDQDVVAVPYYSVFDVFVMPSFYEGLPVTVVEATANGLPCVTSLAVPKEMGFAGNIRSLSLEDPLEDWSKAVLEAVRGDYGMALAQNGYDIAKAAPALEERYFRGSGYEN